MQTAGNAGARSTIRAAIGPVSAPALTGRLAVLDDCGEFAALKFDSTRGASLPRVDFSVRHKLFGPLGKQAGLEPFDRRLWVMFENLGQGLARFVLE
jgi:hypothetical protein